MDKQNQELEIYSPWRDAWRRLKKNKMAMVGLGVIGLLVIIAIFAPYIAPHDPLKVDLMNSLQPPSDEFPLGTDRLGRGIFSRIIYGARISLRVGLITQSIALVIGITLGALAGYYGGWVDEIISYLINVFLAFPFLLFAIAIMATLGPGINNVFLALAIVSWPGLARIVRGQVMSIREEEYVEAVKSLGANDVRIIFKHLIPNCMAPIIVTVTLGVASAILSEAGLSFLGLGAQPPTPSWGLMLSGGRSFIRSNPGMMIYPGLAIMITVLGLNLFGDGLRDVLDPNMKDN
ncbi:MULTISPECIES: nickel transporter permease [unclassified Candidatus Frackibacter]|uniref:nickel transporter permease n=1 Tax=unclassified Candidatus Frackibacter TaxID=2648818 RepID=UPI000890EA3E|nr:MULTISPECIES: nickel transporter permease [unclassified Candidatus Frackibacter]SDC30381.1 oligopeptide transport system permease protein [Candidatus Frackibacter sp. WG11]SEM74350.1 oligopeptide transport system permease protein [Candidatus Frackibacter sp. WG12]SFL58215.1 oligopeptide transport system permease protein [Candidatus Frackibacter sp. WG13]